MLLIHKKLLQIPLYEKNDLSSQLRRASKSIPANIAEGWAKRIHEKEFKRHLDIAMGSTNEMEVHIEIARDLAYWEKNFCEDLLKGYVYLGGKIRNFRNNWKSY